MARSQNLLKSGRPRISRQRQNTLGYAKRKSLKAGTLAGGLREDVYEHQADSVRRGKMKMLLQRNEITGLDGRAYNNEDSAGEEGRLNGRNLNPRLIGENDDEDGILEDEDEEIDSDAAFEESDDERFAGFTFANHKVSKTLISSIV
jgi:U3 small nucleolar RNA-associated protein 14